MGMLECEVCLDVSGESGKPVSVDKAFSLWGSPSLEWRLVPQELDPVCSWVDEVMVLW